MFQDYSLVIAIVVFLAFVIASRSLLMNALKKLSDDDKAKLLSTQMTGGSQTRMLVLVGGMGVYYFALIRYREYMKEIVIGFMVIIIGSRLFSVVRTRRKLIDAGLPDDYIKAYMNSSMLYTFGIIVFFFLMMKNML